MVYRAKITKIRAWVENHYNTCANHIVTDSTDAYIEVRSEEESILLEELNKAKQHEIELKKEWLSRYGSRIY